MNVTQAPILLLDGLACLAFANAAALLIHALWTRRRIRRLKINGQHLHEVVVTLAQDVVRLEQAQQQYTSIVQALRTPSPRRAAAAHKRAMEQAEAERIETARLPVINTRQI